MRLNLIVNSFHIPHFKLQIQARLKKEKWNQSERITIWEGIWAVYLSSPYLYIFMWNSCVSLVSTSRNIIYYFQNPLLFFNIRSSYLRSVSFYIYQELFFLMEKGVLISTHSLTSFSVIIQCFICGRLILSWKNKL